MAVGGAAGLLAGVGILMTHGSVDEVLPGASLLILGLTTVLGVEAGAIGGFIIGHPEVYRPVTGHQEGAGE